MKAYENLENDPATQEWVNDELQITELRRCSIKYSCGKVKDTAGYFTVPPAPYTAHPTTYTLHPTPYTLHPTSYTLHPAPHAPHLVLDTLHRTLFILHPRPHTLQPTPIPYPLTPTP